MRFQAALCALLVWSTGVAAVSPQDVDVFDRPVLPLLSRGRPTMVLYANRGTGESVHAPATQMSVRLKDVPFVTLVRVDLRGLPSLFRGIARRKIKSSHDDSVEEYDRAYKAAGVNPPPDASDRLVFVVDNDGAAHQAVGLPEGFHEALAVVLDCQGREVTRGAFPREVERIEQAIRVSKCPPPPAQARRP